MKKSVRLCGSAAWVVLFFATVGCEQRKDMVEKASDQQHLVGDSTTYFQNDPKYIHPDTTYVPGDYPLAEVGNARAVYYTLRQELERAVVDPTALVSLPSGEIAWTSFKDGGKSVLGYFRNYFGVVRLTSKGITEATLVIDVNSLDSAIPGRNNRILNFFFESMKPEFGTAELKLTQFRMKEGSLKQAEGGKEQAVEASGTLTLNGVTKEITTSLALVKQGKTWSITTRVPLTLLISDYAFGARVFTLMKECNHRSLGNLVKVNAKLFFR
ncbi:MAG TPA: YceI family protein [Bacteroidota bacterium]|nr:YceI family protein [Bacteroidota bacterium]